jgi:hypothetical protein
MVTTSERQTNLTRKKPREKIVIEVAIKKVYPQKCVNHPALSSDLYYVYNGLDAQGNPDLRSGQLLCEECRA